jgi:hypothetical protein
MGRHRLRSPGRRKSEVKSPNNNAYESRFLTSLRVAVAFVCVVLAACQPSSTKSGGAKVELRPNDKLAVRASGNTTIAEALIQACPKLLMIEVGRLDEHRSNIVYAQEFLGRDVVNKQIEELRLRFSGDEKCGGIAMSIISGRRQIQSVTTTPFAKRLLG